MRTPQISRLHRLMSDLGKIIIMIAGREILSGLYRHYFGD